MTKNISYHSLLVIGLLTTTTFLAACAGMTNNSNSSSVQRYTTQECKQMHGRGVINLDQKRKCDMGQSFVVDAKVVPQ